MFKIVNHFVNNTTERNNELLEIFDGIMKRYDVRNKSDPPNVVLLTNKTEMNMYCLGGGQAILENIPSENVFSVDEKYAMISLSEKINHMMAHGMEIHWLQYGSNRPDTRGANGCYSAQKILAKLKIENKHPDKKTAYAYNILWSDSFLKSWVKQKRNSI